MSNPKIDSTNSNSQESLKKKNFESFNDEKLDLFDPTVVPQCREDTLFFKIFFFLPWTFEQWTPEITKAFFTRKFTIKDAPMLTKKSRIKNVMKRFHTCWNLLNKINSPLLKNGPRLLLSFSYCVLMKFCLSVTLNILGNFLNACTPRFMQMFLLELHPLRNSEELDYYSAILPPELRPGDIGGFRSNNYMVWIWLLCVIVVKFVGVTLAQLGWYKAIELGLMIYGCAIGMIYKKALVVSNKSREKYDNGNIVNMISNDAWTLLWGYELITQIGIRFVITLIPSIYFLFELLGISALFGFIVSLIIIPLSIIFFYVVIQLQKKLSKKKDKRIKLLNEILQGISVIKYFVWEIPNLQKLKVIRNEEIKANRIVRLLRATAYSALSVTPMLMGLATFSYYTSITNGNLDPVVVFIALSYFETIKTTILWLPGTLATFVECIVSSKRIQSFLEAEEIDYSPIEMNKSKRNEMDNAIVIKNANFKWERTLKSKTKLKKSILNGLKRSKSKMEMEVKENIEKVKEYGELKDISMTFEKNKFYMICGSIGSGKSSFLNAILCEMKLQSGSMTISSNNFAYVNQTPFIMNGTVIQNILFGEEMDEEKLNKIIQMCCLEDDLRILPSGKNTHIGEKGVNLSGGQKTRIAIARALYKSKSDIYLFDDILSAVDFHVGRKLFENIFCKLLRGKTVILITHQLQYLYKSDYVILMKEGNIFEQGTYKELMKNHLGELNNLINKFTVQKSNEESSNSLPLQNIINTEEIIIEEQKDIPIDSRKKKIQTKLKKVKKLIEDEEQMKGNISFKIIFIFAKSMGIYYAILALCLYIILQILISSNQVYLSLWSSKSINTIYGNGYNTSFYHNITYNNNSTMIPNIYNYNKDIFKTNMSCYEYVYVNNISNMICYNEIVPLYWNNEYKNETIIQNGIDGVGYFILIYSGFSIIIMAFQYFRELLFQNLCVNASMELHNKAIERVLFAPQSWFDKTPIGRIVSRFSLDVFLLDINQPLFLQLLLDTMFGSIGIFVLIMYFSYGSFIIAIIPLFLIYIFLYIFYRRSAIESKRLTNTRRSPVVAHLSESLNGLTSIRAYGKENDFLNENQRRINILCRTLLAWRSSFRWIQLRAGYLGVFVLTIVGIICIVFSHYFPLINLATNSLIFSLAFQSIAFIDMAIRSSSSVESNFTSVERLHYYATKIPIEKGRELESNNNKLQKCKKWITKGEIQFVKYEMKYRKELPLVLKGISFHIKGGENIGICGRTGCGKSSIFKSLLRIIEGHSGHILIDGIDICKIGLTKLRSNITIIPQNPMLFSGTLRYNIDPHNVYNDNDIIEVLEKSHLREIIGKRNGINSIVKEGGENFSVGERQLICLARAMLKSTKILILDECSASVDMESDKLIQESIRNNFDKSTTVLTIAHRLNTIIDADRILVMHEGNVIEFDTPKNLFENEKYFLFKELVNESGKDNAKFLKSLAIKGRGENEKEELVNYNEMSESEILKNLQERMNKYKNETKVQMQNDIKQLKCQLKDLN